MESPVFCAADSAQMCLLAGILTRLSAVQHGAHQLLYPTTIFNVNTDRVQAICLNGVVCKIFQCL